MGKRKESFPENFERFPLKKKQKFPYHAFFPFSKKIKQTSFVSLVTIGSNRLRKAKTCLEETVKQRRDEMSRDSRHRHFQ